MTKVGDTRYVCYCDEEDNFKITFGTYKCSSIIKGMSHWIMHTECTWVKKSKEVYNPWVYGWAKSIPAWCREKCRVEDIRGFNLRLSKVSAARLDRAQARKNLKYHDWYDAEDRVVIRKEIKALTRYINRYSGSKK